MRKKTKKKAGSRTKSRVEKPEVKIIKPKKSAKKSSIKPRVQSRAPRKSAKKKAVPAKKAKADGAITLSHITKIEGHASLVLNIQNNKVKKCELAVIEGSRYFEGMLKDRRYDEASEITSRICGICSCAHTVCAITAIENALNVRVSKQTEELRKLLMMGERIRSHATHLYFLALPDFLGYESAMQMLPKFKKQVHDALKLMKAGNEIVKLVGGRDIHPVAATVGGFHVVPTSDEIYRIKTELQIAKKTAVATAELFAKLKYPDFSPEATTYLSLHNPFEYPILHGAIKTPEKLFKKTEFHKFIKEYHEPRSSANFAVKEGKAYFTGALARVNNNSAALSQTARKLLKHSKFKFPSRNPFLNNYCQAIELVHCIDHSIAICQDLARIKPEPLAAVSVRESYGIAAVEVPRGVLWHEYKLNSVGTIVKANIVTPTSQNLRKIEDDIKAFLPELLASTKDRDTIVLEIEKLIRAYDPCFSCSTHFLDVKWG
ncbi:MAG: Ni/Fe hydrogenase subunit alpha [Candidatus Woesearchaeota archaeon]